MAAVFGLSQVFHLLVFAFFVRFDKFGFTELIPQILDVDQLGDNLLWILPQFATMWVQVVFQIYFLLSLLEDILALTPKTFWASFKQDLNKKANNMFTFYVIPYTLVMCVNFWVIFLIDRNQIDEYHVIMGVFDRVTNHVFHTYVIPVMLIEMCITSRHYPPSATVVYPYVKITKAIATYFTVVFGMKLLSPVWPYPFFKAMTASQWVAYISFNLLMACVFYGLGFYCHSFVWGKQDAASVQCATHSEEEGSWKMRSTRRKLPKIARWTVIPAGDG